MKEFILTKQISKQGTKSVLIIPKFLEKQIRPKDIVEVRIKILSEDENNE